MGRLDEGKGIKLLLETFSDGEFDRSRLVVAGSLDSEFSRDLEQQYGNAGNIEFLGHVRPSEFYRDIDVLVVPSLWNDTLPTVVLEAMQYGLPVIASNLGGIPEMIEDGKTGWLFDPGMPGQLKDRMLMMNHDVISGVAPAVQEKATCFVDHDRFVREYAGLYADVMGFHN